MSKRAQDKFYWFLIPLVAFLMALTVSCALLPESASAPGRGQVEVKPVDVGDRDRALYAALLDHPHGFDPGAIEASMRSLFFSRRTPSFPEAKRKIFSEETAQEVAPLIDKAFLAAKPYQVVRFRIRSDQGLTAGDTFVKDGALHWRFELIDGLPQFEEFYNPFQYGTETGPPANWTLIPKEGQRYYDDSLLGLTGRTDWLVVDLSGAAGKGAGPTADASTLMARLRALQELKRAQAISPAQYREKLGAMQRAEPGLDATPKDRVLFWNELRKEGLVSEDEYHRRVQEILDRL